VTAATTPTPILLIEDNPTDARLVRAMLELEGGLEITHFDRLGTARESFAGMSDGCVLLDLSLPDAHGLEALAEVRQTAPEVAVVVLSGLADETVALSAVQQGAQDYLIKGQVDGAVLARAIRYAIERKRAEVQLAHQTLHDALTNLPNRLLFLDRLRQALARSARRRAHIAVLFLDLDRFLRVNDALGHAMGDAVLVETAQRFETAVRPGDTVARFAGDKFTVMCEDIAGEHDALAIAERLTAALAFPFDLDGEEHVLTASIGIALSQGENPAAESLIRDADAAMHRAKERGRARVELFDESVRHRAVIRLSTESALRRALREDELRLHYQPEIDLASGKAVGVEALVRWDHPERGLLEPVEFIQLAEETGLIIPLGEWVLSEACRQLAAWRREHPERDLFMAVNLSTRQLRDPDLEHAVARALSSAGVEPSHLFLEVTESLLLDDPVAGLKVLARLRDSGIRIAIDDFGTGFASLSYLRRFPADVLKIDQSFIVSVADDARDRAIVGAVIELGRALGLSVVAEGVETGEQAEQVARLGCDLAQGFWFARAQPAANVADLLK
jgi:diguanylate cyclase (GGDEF)-like protein